MIELRIAIEGMALRENLARDIEALLVAHEAHLRNTVRALEHRLNFEPSP